MPIQAPQWTDYLNCPACCREFAPSRSPISLGCGHTLCRLCINNLHRRQCPFDQSMILADLEELVVNTALLQLAGYTPPVQPYHPLSIKALSEQDRDAYDCIVKCLEQLAVFLKYCGNANSLIGSRLSRPMQRKLVTLLQCAVTDEEGRGKAARAARSLGDRTVTELIVQHQNPQQLSANLWAAVRSRGCQFLGPAMQEEVLKLVLLALEDGSALSRKVLVMFVVQRLEPHFPQASKTSIGHVVQLLYRASCFKVSKRVCDSSLMQLKEEFRTYDSLRREHDAQIVQIATEAGLRIAPDQWSALLYGDTKHKSHMQSIIDKLQTPQSFAQSVQELFITLQRTGDPAQLIAMSIPLDRLANIDASPDANSPTWQELSAIITSLKEVVSRLIHFMQHQNTTRDANYNAKAIERIPDSPSHQSTVQGMPGRYKVAMCRDAQTRTYCPRGNTCTYAHNEVELDRYRRVISGGNYYVQPVVPQPVYHQRFSVPPPPIHKENNFKTTMQQQASPSSRGSANCGDAMDREHNREVSYKHVREHQYDVRETQYKPPSTQIYNHTRDQLYDPAREHITYHVQEHHDQAREQPDHSRNQLYDQPREHHGYHAQEQQYEQGREQQEYQIREPYYDPANKHLYNQARGNDHGRDHSHDAREQSYEYRDPTYEHTTLNVTAENYIPSYANAVMRGGAANKRSVNNSQHELPRENGSANTSEVPAGNYYYTYENPPYPYINTGHMTNERMIQYPMGGPTASDPNQQHQGYNQLTYIQEGMPVIHYETLSYAVAVPHQMPRAQQQQESVWPTNKTIKSPPMFKIDKKAKNVPIGMEIGKTMPISLDMGMNMAVGRGMGNNMPIGRIKEINMPIGSDMEKGLDIGLDMVTNMPIDVEMAQDIAVGTGIAERIAIGAKIATHNLMGTGIAKNMAIGAEIAKHNPIGTGIAKNIAIGAEIAKQHLIRTGIAKNIAIGAEIAKNNQIGTDIAENIAIGADIAKNNLIGTEIAENIAIGAEIAKNNPIGTDIAENIAIGAEIAKDNPIGTDIAENIAIGAEIAKNNPIGTDIAENIAIGAEIAKHNPIGTDTAENIAIGSDIAKHNPIGTEMANKNPIDIKMPKNNPIGTKVSKNNPKGTKMAKNNSTDTEIANKPTAPKTNGGVMDRGSDNLMNKSKARTETQKRNDVSFKYAQSNKPKAKFTPRRI